MPLLETSELTQTTPHGCGATAFEILFRFHYPRKPLPDWGELADPVRGIGPGALELFVRKEFRNVCIGHLDLHHLRFLAGFTPVICLVTVAPGHDHWLCVRSVTAHRVHVQDPNPERPRHAYTHAEWLANWRDATEGGAFERFAIAGWK